MEGSMVSWRCKRSLWKSDLVPPTPILFVTKWIQQNIQEGYKTGLINSQKLLLNSKTVGN